MFSPFWCVVSHLVVHAIFSNRTLTFYRCFFFPSALLNLVGNTQTVFNFSKKNFSLHPSAVPGEEEGDGPLPQPWLAGRSPSVLRGYACFLAPRRRGSRWSAPFHLMRCLAVRRSSGGHREWRWPASCLCPGWAELRPASAASLPVVRKVAFPRVVCPPPACRQLAGQPPPAGGVGFSLSLRVACGGVGVSVSGSVGEGNPGPSVSNTMFFTEKKLKREKAVVRLLVPFLR